MSERLRHLQRQQALLREHLAWLDQEIAAVTSATPETQPAISVLVSPPQPAVFPASEAAAAPAISPSATAISTPAVAEDADTLIKRYADQERLDATTARRGCLLIFVAALALLVLGVTAVWLIRYR